VDRRFGPPWAARQIAKSFVPPAPQRELLRYRRKLVGRTQTALPETANIELASVADMLASASAFNA
jgi:hypothetical protein